MKLVSVRVQNYKCIDDSGEFSVLDLTCLAGKNEAGKTALLQALRRLKPVEESEGQFDELMEYPRRRLHELEEGGTKSQVLTTTWKLSDADVEAVEEALGLGSIACCDVVIKRGYGNRSFWTIKLNQEAIISFFVKETPRLTQKARERILKCESIKDLYIALNSNSSNLTIGEQEVMDRIEAMRDRNPNLQAIDILSEKLPRFLYFSTYGTLPGRVSVEDIAEKEEDQTRQTEGERLFLALLSLAGTDVKELSSAGQYENLKAKLEIVSNRLSQQIFEYWTQNRDLKVEFDYREALQGDVEPFNVGHVFNLRVENQRHRVTVGFDERSAGVTRQPNLPVASMDFAALTPCLTVDSATLTRRLAAVASISFAGLSRSPPADSAPHWSDSSADRTQG